MGLRRSQPTERTSRTGPGLQPIPGYEWGASHAAEPAYLFPGFDNGVPIAATFDAGEQQLATEMKQYWGAFAQRGDPGVPGQTAWSSYDAEQVVLSLQPGGRSTLLSDAALADEHQCAFWDPLTSG